MNSNGRPLVPYMRQSRRKERTISIEEQRRDIQAWAKANGVALAAEVIEQGVSGSKSWRERALGGAVDACERGEASGIIVAWQDRLSRENGRATAEVWEALEQAGIRFVVANEGLDTATGDHGMTFTIKAAIARDQWKRHRSNWEAARRNAIEANVFPGRTPIGYRRDKGKRFQPNGREAAKVLAAFEERREGLPFSEIARRHGWSDSTTRQILENEVYLGVIEHGAFRKENAHPEIVSRELFDAVQATRTTEPVPPGETTRDRLLLGLVRCSGCGRTLKVVRRKRADGSFVVSYYCKDAASERCPSRAFVHADELDAFVGDWFTEALRSVPRMIDVVSAGRELEQAQVNLEALERDLRGYVEVADAADPVLFRRGLEARQQRVTEAHEQVQHLSARLTRIPAGGSLSELWGGFDVGRRRTVLRGFLDRVEVDKGASDGHLAERVRIFWSDGSIVSDEAGVGEVAA
jgi:DNA invertase Pin-like site-specific DNA recombinase